MNKMKKLLAVILAVVTVAFAFAACSGATDKDSTTATKEKAKAALTIAVEKGSAGEKEAKKLTKNVVSLAAQSDALKEVKAGTADACIIDSTMANSMTAEGTDFADLGYSVKLTTEEYGIGFRKGSDLTAEVNKAIVKFTEDGTLQSLSDKYGVNIVENKKAAESETQATVKDVDKVKKAGKIVIGVTDYEPIDYKAEDGSWTGFDADFAMAFAKELGVEVEFVEINWDNKFTELNSGAIDCIWNGMTISDSVTKNCDVSMPYASNSQVVVMKKDKLADYPDADSINSLK